MRILVINCGSATLKYKVFAVDQGEMQRLASGVVETTSGYRAAVTQALESLPRAPDVIAHRVVHGGDRFPEVVRVDVPLLNQLRELSSLAPLHNGPALEGIEATLGVAVPLVAAFDTAFHRTLPARAARYALPELPGIRRYGFHGWSHRSVMERYAELTGNPSPTIITLHLGSGCSAAAIRQGQSIDTSMGFTPLEGLVMATRPGDLDPGILMHLMQQGMTLDRIRTMLNRECGFQGLAGTSDMRELLGRTDDAASLAVEIFCYRIIKYVGAYWAVLGGAEAIVFTGGIGENSPEIRHRISEGLAWTGLEMDEARNAAGEERISSGSSRPAVYNIRTNEELLIAREASRLLDPSGVSR